MHRHTVLLALTAGFFSLGTAARGQTTTTGTIRGTVVDAQSLAGVEAVQVHIPGTSVGTLTNAAGEFVLPRVPAGRHTVRAVRIGSTPSDQTVDVAAGESKTVRFTLARTAISLAEVVVTGTGGATEKRKLGNSLASVSASEIVKSAPVTTFPEMLQGRTAGVNMIPSGGTIGAGGNLRIRGLTSVTQSGDPVIYIDGVQIDLSSNGPNVGGITPSRLTDLATADIERIEVVKGAAATTLYGTQGSNGVIQIFTKRGATGRARWNAEIENGFERLNASRMPGRLWTEFQGPSGYRAHDPREIIENGFLQNYGGSVAGGLEALSYFFSGGYNREESSIAPANNWLRRVNGRANVNAVLTPKVSLGANIGLTGSLLRIPDNDNALHGLYSQVVSGVPWTADSTRRWGERWGSWDINRTIENLQNVHRFVGGTTLEIRPMQQWSNKMTVGLDWVDEENTRYVPYGFKGSGIPFGQRSNQRRRADNVTIDLQSVLSASPFSRITSELAVGAQGVFRTDTRTLASGMDFPAPGVTTVSSTARTTSAETRVKETNAGVFLQEQIGIADRLFVTGGVRVDGNSAFGEDFPLQAYPKASIAYDLTHERFWPSRLIPTMKVRAAFGVAGRSPAQFSADQTYIAIAAENGTPAVSPGNVGDPNLGPEKSQELEIGFDAGLWNDRLGIELTYYNQRTADALVQKQFPPSLGFVSTQFTNIGEVRNHGLEVGLRALVISRKRFDWDVNVQLSSQTNEVSDLGGSPPISSGNAVRIVQGYPILGIWTRGLKSWDATRRTHVASDTLIYRGSAAPEWRGSFQSKVRLFSRWTLTGLADFATGFHEQNFAKGWSISKLTGDDYLALTVRPRGTPTPAADSLLNLVSVLGPGYFVERADFLKFRELAVSYQLPQIRMGGLPLRDASLRLAARNLWVYAPNYGNPDPEVSTNGNSTFSRGSDFNTQPPARRFLLSFRTSF
jgi:TonB-dependent starch-binding outer membrane protein SusC